MVKDVLTPEGQEVPEAGTRNALDAERTVWGKSCSTIGLDGRLSLLNA